MSAASTAPAPGGRPNSTTSSTPKTSRRDRRAVDGGPPGGRLVEPLPRAAGARSASRPRASEDGRSCRSARSCRRECRGACGCACASSGPWADRRYHDGRERILDQMPLGIEAAQRNVLRKALERGPRSEADQLRLGHRRALADTLDELAQRHRAVVVHVGRDLRPPAVLEIEPERPDSRQAAARLAQLGGDRLRELDVIRRQVDVERDQRRARRGEHRARRRMGAPRSEVRDELTRLDAPFQPRRAAAPDVGALALLRPRRELAVQEHRHPELLAHEPGGRQRLRAGGAAALVVEVDDRHHVERAHVRVDAVVARDVDPLDRRPGEVQERRRQLALRRREREHGAVVVGIGVQVEEARRRQRALDRLERGEVPALAHVGHGHQQRRLCHRVQRYADGTLERGRTRGARACRASACPVRRPHAQDARHPAQGRLAADQRDRARVPGRRRVDRQHVERRQGARPAARPALRHPQRQRRPRRLEGRRQDRRARRGDHEQSRSPRTPSRATRSGST